METKEILDNIKGFGNDSPEKISLGIILILMSVGFSILSYLFGSLRMTCGINGIDLLINFVVIGISIFGYKLITEKLSKVKWWFTIIFICLNLFLGIMNFIIVC